MRMIDFFENLAEQFDETLPSELKADTNFKELPEWSSLTALSIIAMIDEEYNVTITGEDIKNSSTIEDLFNIVIDKSKG